MTPSVNWTAISAAIRAAVTMFLVTFIGALVGTGDGLPTTWTGWRPLLITSLAAAGLQELMWLRSHLSAIAGASVSPATATVAASKADQRGSAQVAVLALLSAGLIAFGISAGTISACNSVPPAVPTGVVTGIQDGVAAAECVLSRYGQDVAKGLQTPAIVADIVLQCGLTELQVTGLLDAHRGAMTLELAKDAGK